MPGFIRTDDDGPYLRCVEWLITDGVGQVCGGRMRPTDDGDRWRCPDCGATVGYERRRVRADGGEPLFGPDRHDPVEVTTPPDGASDVERLEAAVDLAVEAHERGDDPRLAAEWALGQVDLDAAWLVGLQQRLLERLGEGGEEL